MSAIPTAAPTKIANSRIWLEGFGGSSFLLWDWPAFCDFLGWDHLSSSVSSFAAWANKSSRPVAFSGGKNRCGRSQFPFSGALCGDAFSGIQSIISSSATSTAGIGEGNEGLPNTGFVVESVFGSNVIPAKRLSALEAADGGAGVEVRERSKRLGSSSRTFGGCLIRRFDDENAASWNIISEGRKR